MYKEFIIILINFATTEEETPTVAEKILGIKYFSLFFSINLTSKNL
jgi:hypothetical protein